MVWWLLLGAGLSSVFMIIATIYLGIFADRRQTRIMQDYLATKNSSEKHSCGDPEEN